MDQHFEEAGHQPVKGNAQVSFEERFALGVDSSEDEDEDGDQDQMGDEQVEKGSQSGSDTSFSGDDDV